MKSTIIYIVIGILIIVGGWFLLHGNTATAPSSSPLEETTAQKKEFTLVVENKKIISGPATLTVTQGDIVMITVTADEEEEFHVHGYDRSVDLKKGVPAMLTFQALASGRFMFELEESKTDIGALEVLP